MTPGVVFSALGAFRACGRLGAYDALWSAAGWEAEAERLLRERPNALTARYDGGSWGTLRRPWPRASGEEAVDLAAGARLREYARRTAETLAEDDGARRLVEAWEATHLGPSPGEPLRVRRIGSRGPVRPAYVAGRPLRVERLVRR